MKAIDWTSLYRKYRGMWVALKHDEKTVIGSGKTANRALQQAKDKGEEHPILHRVPLANRLYIG